MTQDAFADISGLALRRQVAGKKGQLVPGTMA